MVSKAETGRVRRSWKSLSPLSIFSPMPEHYGLFGDQGSKNYLIYSRQLMKMEWIPLCRYIIYRQNWCMDSESTRGTVDSQSHLHFVLFSVSEQFWHPGAGLKSQPSVTSLLPNLRPLTTFSLTSIIRVRGGLEGRALFYLYFTIKEKSAPRTFLDFYTPNLRFFRRPVPRFFSTLAAISPQNKVGNGQIE